jgi:nickel transport protein
MNTRLLSLAVALVLTTVPAGSCFAHGVAGNVVTQRAVRLQAVYDGREPMSYAAVEITLENEKIPFQTGRTDRNGVFCFRPDRLGTWEIVVEDGMGHRLFLETRVDESLALAEEAGTGNGQTMPGRY